MSRKEKSLEKNETILLSALRGIAKKIENEIDNSEEKDKRHIKIYLPKDFPELFTMDSGSKVKITAFVMPDGNFMMEQIEIELHNEHTLFVFQNSPFVNVVGR